MSLILFLSFDAAPAVMAPSAQTLDVAKEAAALVGGEDTWFDVSQGDRANTIVTPAGDYLSVSGITALKQSLIRRTITRPGDWKTKPNYGVGAVDYVKAKDTPATRAELTARIKSQYLQDKRVKSVDQVAIERFTDGIGPGLKVNIRFTPRGQLLSEQSETLAFEVR